MYFYRKLYKIIKTVSGKLRIFVANDRKQVNEDPDEKRQPSPIDLKYFNGMLSL